MAGFVVITRCLGWLIADSRWQVADIMGEDNVSSYGPNAALAKLKQVASLGMDVWALFS